MSVKSYTVTCNACPHQAEGQLDDGRWFYFRARHNSWSISIGTSVADAVNNEIDGEAFACGDDPHGWLSYGNAPKQARQLVEAICVIATEPKS